MDFSEDEELPAAAFAQSDANRDETTCLGTFSEDGAAGELDTLIKQSLQMNIRDICRQIEKNEELMCATSSIGAAGISASVKMSSEAITALTELTYEYVTTTLATDLVAFSQHNAKRTSINVDDVKLVLRRAPPSLRQKLDDFCIKHHMVDMKSCVGQKKANSVTAPASASASVRKSSAHKAGVSTAKKSKAGKGLKSQRRGSSRTSESRQSLQVSRGRVRATDTGSSDDVSTSGDDDDTSSEDEDEPIVLRRSNKKGAAQSKSKGNLRHDDEGGDEDGEEDDNTDIDPIQSTSETEEEECIDLSETIDASPMANGSTKTPSRRKAATTSSNKQSTRKISLSKNHCKTNSNQGFESTTLSLAQADLSDKSSAALQSDSSDASSDFGGRAAPSQVYKRRMPLSKTFLEDSTDTSSNDAF